MLPVLPRVPDPGMFPGRSWSASLELLDCFLEIPRMLPPQLPEGYRSASWKSLECVPEILEVLPGHIHVRFKIICKSLRFCSVDTSASRTPLEFLMFLNFTSMKG